MASGFYGKGTWKRRDHPNLGHELKTHQSLPPPPPPPRAPHSAIVFHPPSTHPRVLGPDWAQSGGALSCVLFRASAALRLCLRLGAHNGVFPGHRPEASWGSEPDPDTEPDPETEEHCPDLPVKSGSGPPGKGTEGGGSGQHRVTFQESFFCIPWPLCFLSLSSQWFC